MAVIDTGTSTAGKANVDSNFNLNVVTPTTATKAGYSFVASNVKGDDTAAALALTVDATLGRQLAMAPTQLLWDDTFNMTAQNTAKYKAPVTTQTVAFAGGFAVLNNSAITTINTDSALQTYRSFPLFGKSELRVNMSVLLTQVPQANDVVEMGVLNAVLPGRAAPTDGVFFRYNTAAELRGVINYNGTETQTAAITAPSANVAHDYLIVVQTDTVLFYIDGVHKASITLLTDAPTLGQPMMAASVPLTFRHYIGGSAPGLAQQVKITDAFISLRGSQLIRDWPSAKSGFGHMLSQGQNGGTMGTTALYTNSLAVGAGAAMTNTTAALGTGLGGQFTTTPTLAVPTDGIVCSFQNPTPTVNITGRNLILIGVTIDAVVSAALTGGPVLYFYSLAYGHTAVSMATAEAATTKAPRRIALGIQNFVVTAAAGAQGTRIQQTFTSPIVIAPSEFVAIVAKNVGVVTSAGTITFLVTYDGYWE